MGFKLGIDRQFVTPTLGGLFAGYDSPKRSERVHDDLTVTAFLFEGNGARALLMSATVCLIENEICDELRKICGEAAGIPRENVIISAVHTHSGPVTVGAKTDWDYVEAIFKPKFAEAAANAAKNIREVTTGVAVSKSLVGINRRKLHRDGSVTLSHNPWGAYDPEMTVVAFKYLDGTPAANIIHCAAHCTAAGVVTEVTRDWCGVMIDRLEAQSGAVTMFLNGSAGDVAPRMPNGDSVGNMQLMREIGALAGIDAVKTYNEIREYRPVEMKIAYGEVKIPYAPPKPLALAREQYVAIENSSARFDGGRRKLLKSLIEMHERNEFGPENFSFKQTIVKIGPVVFIPFPFEHFSEISMRMRAYSRFGYTLTVGYANGSNSYLPSQDQICRGGYEVEMFNWAMARQLPDDADTKIINENLRIMDGL